jgi:hypothetical protein
VTRTATITTDEGSWQGTLTGGYTTETSDIITWWYVGTGAYEGMSMFVWITESNTYAINEHAVYALIFPGTPPPTPSGSMVLATQNLMERSGEITAPQVSARNGHRGKRPGAFSMPSRRTGDLGARRSRSRGLLLSSPLPELGECRDAEQGFECLACGRNEMGGF